jgi:hypothetical protein
VEPRAAPPPPAPVICVRVRVMLTDEAGPIASRTTHHRHGSHWGPHTPHPFGAAQSAGAFYDPLTAEEGPIGSRAIHTVC